MSFHDEEDIDPYEYNAEFEELMEDALGVDAEDALSYAEYVREHLDD